MNYDGLKNAIIEMLSGSEVEVNTATFKNDPAKIQNRDDVITYLIHLGYLGYNEDNDTAFVPNEEIRQELITAVKSSNWDELIAFQQESRNLLIIDERLRERESGFDGNRHGMFQKRWANHEYHEEGGESIAMVQRRNMEALNEILSDNSDKE